MVIVNKETASGHPHTPSDDSTVVADGAPTLAELQIAIQNLNQQLEELQQRVVQLQAEEWLLVRLFVWARECVVSFLWCLLFWMTGLQFYAM
ncbi:hypothetical protein C8F01DRAFT_1251845 [Mycena amicta]|nr:hypothetical protein C8F01DRAFT_1251845 [Mycena amicta]